MKIIKSGLLSLSPSNSPTSSQNKLSFRGSHPQLELTALLINPQWMTASRLCCQQNPFSLLPLEIKPIEFTLRARWWTESCRPLFNFPHALTLSTRAPFHGSPRGPGLCAFCDLTLREKPQSRSIHSPADESQKRNSIGKSWWSAEPQRTHFSKMLRESDGSKLGKKEKNPRWHKTLG